MALPKRESVEEQLLHPKLSELRNLRPGWDGESAPAPNDGSLSWANRVIEAAADLRLAPNVVMACIDGGVSLLFANRSRKALVECYNEGEVTAVLSDSGGAKDAWMISDNPTKLPASILRIRDFLAG